MKKSLPIDMISGIGVDILELDRLRKNQEKLAKKVLSTNEYQVYQTKKTIDQKIAFLGGRFAAKEAYLKALGSGIGGIELKDIDILNTDAGQPYIKGSNAQISISHEKNYVISFVIIEKDR